MQTKKLGRLTKKAEDVATANGKLRLEVAKQEIAAHKSAAELAAQMEKVNVYAQGVGLQQQSMAHQIQAAISISDGQVQILGNALKPFAGQKVDLRMTMDSTSGRIANQIGRAFAIANVSTGPGTATYAGATFQGISIVVQKVDGHPPIADVLISTFTSIGIAVHPVVEPSFPADIVTICIGPQ